MRLFEEIPGNSFFNFLDNYEEKFTKMQVFATIVNLVSHKFLGRQPKLLSTDLTPEQLHDCECISDRFLKVIHQDWKNHHPDRTDEELSKFFSVLTENFHRSCEDQIAYCFQHLRSLVID